MLGNEAALCRTVDGEVRKLRNTTLTSCRHMTEPHVNVDKATHPCSETRLLESALPTYEREHRGVLIYEVHFKTLNGTPAAKIGCGKPGRRKRHRFTPPDFEATDDCCMKYK